MYTRCVDCNHEEFSVNHDCACGCHTKETPKPSGKVKNIGMPLTRNPKEIAYTKLRLEFDTLVSDFIDKHPDITYSELTGVLTNALLVWNGHARKDEWRVEGSEV